MNFKLHILLISIITLLLASCAAYKQLKPKPEISFIEQGYIEIKDRDENFELKKDKKYFMKFPEPAKDNIYLVLNISDKAFLNSYLTNAFDDGKGTIIKIKDESHDPERISVYQIDRSVQNFYWVIDNVRMDMILQMEYRYVVPWRFKFEIKHAEFQETLSNNLVDSSAYKAIGISLNFDDFDFSGEIASIEKKSSELNKVHQDLLEIESIFPVDILNTKDKAYQDYQDIKENIEDELDFQKNYLAVLNLFRKERETRGDVAGFIEALSEFSAFFSQKGQFPNNVLDEAKDVIGSRLPEIVPFYEQKISQKNDANHIDSKIDHVEELYKLTDVIIPDDFSELAGFIRSYNKKVDEVWTAKKQLTQITDSVNKSSTMPSNTFFGGVLTKISKLQYKLPKTGVPSSGKYQKSNCVRILNKEITKLRNEVSSLIDKYRRADRLVPQINVLKEQKNYRGMLRLLKQSSDLGFLLNIYKGVDQLSLNEQTRRIKAALANNNWQQAEANLQSLHYDNNFLYPKIIKPKKAKLVKTLEDTLFNRVDKVSRQRAQKLISENIKTLEDVDVLYMDPAFLPVYELKFTSGNQSDFQRRTKALNDHLQYLKEQEFPQLAIKELYSEFTQNPNDNGVLRARAIVAHGSQYKGNDNKIKNRVAECDPWASKWITKPKSYRKIFALPSTSNRGGENLYVFRLNIRIPSEAKFPVYDINIKLPKEVAKDAASQQWYEKITMNKDILKNEGRFTITSPTPLNNYECQISPVRMIKDRDNVLEVRFKHNSFKVFEVSVMAQKPIIKKN